MAAPVPVGKAKPALVVLDGANLKDIPALYRVPAPLPHEQPVVGVWVDPRVTTGYKYRVQALDEQVSTTMTDQLKMAINLVIYTMWLRINNEDFECIQICVYHNILLQASYCL